MYKTQKEIAYDLVTDLFKDKVDKVKPLAGTNELKNILSNSFIT